MQPALRSKTIIEANESTAHGPAFDVAGDVHGQRGRWERFLDALFQWRMWSARREIERHSDWILFWRRGLAERGAHLRPVANECAEGSTDAPASHGQQSANLGGSFMRVRLMFDTWRKRVRLRRELMGLSASDLHDIRWTRAEVEAEGRKPFWRA